MSIKESLSKLTRSKIQAKAKKYGIAANLKTVTIIDLLVEKILSAEIKLESSRSSIPNKPLNRSPPKSRSPPVRDGKKSALIRIPPRGSRTTRSEKSNRRNLTTPVATSPGHEKNGALPTMEGGLPKPSAGPSNVIIALPTDEIAEGSTMQEFAGSTAAIAPPGSAPQPQIHLNPTSPKSTEKCTLVISLTPPGSFGVLRLKHQIPRPNPFHTFSLNTSPSSPEGTPEPEAPAHVLKNTVDIMANLNRSDQAFLDQAITYSTAAQQLHQQATQSDSEKDSSDDEDQDQSRSSDGAGQGESGARKYPSPKRLREEDDNSQAGPSSNISDPPKKRRREIRPETNLLSNGKEPVQRHLNEIDRHSSHQRLDDSSIARIPTSPLHSERPQSGSFGHRQPSTALLPNCTGKGKRRRTPELDDTETEVDVTARYSPRQRLDEPPSSEAATSASHPKPTDKFNLTAEESEQGDEDAISVSHPKFIDKGKRKMTQEENEHYERGDSQQAFAVFKQTFYESPESQQTAHILQNLRAVEELDAPVFHPLRINASDHYQNEVNSVTNPEFDPKFQAAILESLRTNSSSPSQFQ